MPLSNLENEYPIEYEAIKRDMSLLAQDGASNDDLRRYAMSTGCIAREARKMINQLINEGLVKKAIPYMDDADWKSAAEEVMRMWTTDEWTGSYDSLVREIARKRGLDERTLLNYIGGGGGVGGDVPYQERRQGKLAQDFLTWFNTFLEEKQLPYASWEIDTGGPYGTNYIDSDMVIELIKEAPPGEQAQIKDTIVKIDFANGDVNDFFNHLAESFLKTQGY